MPESGTNTGSRNMVWSTGQHSAGGSISSPPLLPPLPKPPLPLKLPRLLALLQLGGPIPRRWLGALAVARNSSSSYISSSQPTKGEKCMRASSSSAAICTAPTSCAGAAVAKLFASGDTFPLGCVPHSTRPKEPESLSSRSWKTLKERHFDEEGNACT